ASDSPGEPMSVRHRYSVMAHGDVGIGSGEWVAHPSPAAAPRPLPSRGRGGMWPALPPQLYDGTGAPHLAPTLWGEVGPSPRGPGEGNHPPRNRRSQPLSPSRQGERGK